MQQLRSILQNKRIPYNIMIRPIRLEAEKFDYDITLVVKTRQLTFRECQHRSLSNIETLDGQRMEKSTFYYCPICKDYRTIKDIN